MGRVAMPPFPFISSNDRRTRMKTIIEHLTPFTERIPPEGTDLFVCEEKDTERRYGIMRFFRKGTLLPGPCCGGKTPEERLLEQIFHETSRGEYAPAT